MNLNRERKLLAVTKAKDGRSSLVMTGGHANESWKRISTGNKYVLFGGLEYRNAVVGKRKVYLPSLRMISNSDF